MKTNLSVMLMMALMAGCGSGKSSPSPAGTPGNGDGQGAPAPSANVPDASSLLLGDQEATSQVIAAQIDTGISAAAEENPSSQSGLSLADSENASDADKSLDFKRSRTCAVQGNDAVVSIHQSVERDFAFNGPKRTDDTDFASYLAIQRTWSRADGTAVACAADGEHAELSVPSMAGVVLNPTIDESRGRTITQTNKITGRSIDRSFKYTETGSRQVNWASVTLSAGSYAVQKSASHTLDRQVEIHAANGTVTTLDSSVQNASGAAFQILVERDQATLDVTSRTIQSGTLEATHKDGTRVETVFKNVRYEPATTCMAVSGEIDGSIFKNGETTASLTYVITFANDEKTIVYSNGKTVEYTADGCVLDEPEEKAAPTPAADIQAPAAAVPAPAA